MTYHEIEKAALTEPYIHDRIKAVILLSNALRRYRAAVKKATEAAHDINNYRDVLWELEEAALKIDEDTEEE